MKKFLLFISFSVFFTDVWAQNTCSQTLREARTVYDEGRLHELPELLEKCLKNGFTKEERTEAYKLLVLTHIYLDNDDLAEEMMLNFLRTDPLFKINEAVDASEFINLYNEFRTWPTFRIGLRLGANVTQVNVLSANGVNNFNPESGSRGEYTPKTGFTAAVATEILLSSSISLNPEFHLINKAFQFSNNALFTNPDNSSVTSNILNEKQTWVEFQLLGQYQFTLQNFNPYIALGGAVAYNLNSESINEREITSEQPIRENTLELERKSTDYAIVGAFGLKRAFNRGYFVLDVRMTYGLNDISNSGEILDKSPEYFFNYFAPYNEFAINNMAVTFGYLHNIYNPKKVK